MWRYPRWPLADISLATSNVCFRSKADMTVASQNVRLDPKRTNRPSAAPAVLSGGGMSDRAHGGFGVDDLPRLLGDRKSQKVFDFRVHAVSSKSQAKDPGRMPSHPRAFATGKLRQRSRSRSR